LLLRDKTCILFPTMCKPKTRMSLVPRSLIFFCPSTCPQLYIFLPLISLHYGLIIMIIGFER
jgi:hypothetical protein